MPLNIRFSLIFIIILLLVFAPEARRRGGSRGQTSFNVKNTFTHGGSINNWVLMMPVREGSTDSVNDSASIIDGTIYRDKLLDSELFDSTGRIKNRDVSLLAKTRSHMVEADSIGWVTPKEEPYQFYYAYSTIEAHVTERVRLFLLGRGVFRVWLNGAELTKGIGTITGDEPIYFDASFKQGDNSLLILFLPDGKNSFLLEVYPGKRELVPFKKRLDDISIELKTYSPGSKVLKGKFNFNIPVPKKSFYTDLILSTDSDSSGSVFRVLDSMPPDSEFTFDIPSGYNGVVKLTARTSFYNGKIIKDQRFIWIGDLDKDFSDLKEKSNGLCSNALKVNYDKIPMGDFLIKGICRWNNHWFKNVARCSTDQEIRELGYISVGCSILDMVNNKGRLPKGADFPIFTNGQKDSTITDGHYDHVDWLNYKYPEHYKKAKEKSNSGYEMWVSIPAAAYRRNKKIDMVLYLHDLKTTNPSGLSSLRFEGPVISDKKRSIVLSPLSENGVLWNEYELSAIVKEVTKSKRNKRCYITGEGMGGFETYNLIVLNSGLVTAGLVLNAFTTDDDLCNLKDIPLWIFHGNSNKIVPVENSLNTVNALKECGNRKIEYSVFSEDAENIGPVVYEDPATYKWLYRQ